MKKKPVMVSIIGLVVLLFVATMGYHRAGLIKGTINPPGGATQVWAISGADTLRANVSAGAFEIKNVKTGTYTLLVEAVAPYKPISKPGVHVLEEEQVDVGEIRLERLQ
jgi:hypothetical protein